MSIVVTKSDVLPADVVAGVAFKLGDINGKNVLLGTYGLPTWPNSKCFVIDFNYLAKQLAETYPVFVSPLPERDDKHALIATLENTAGSITELQAFFHSNSTVSLVGRFTLHQIARHSNTVGVFNGSFMVENNHLDDVLYQHIRKIEGWGISPLTERYGLGTFRGAGSLVGIAETGTVASSEINTER